MGSGISTSTVSFTSSRRLYPNICSAANNNNNTHYNREQDGDASIGPLPVALALRIVPRVAVVWETVITANCTNKNKQTHACHANMHTTEQQRKYIFTRGIQDVRLQITHETRTIMTPKLLKIWHRRNSPVHTG